MATALPKFELVDSKEMPKTVKVLSPEEQAYRKAMVEMLSKLQPSQAAKFALDGDNTARTVGIRIGHIINDMGDEYKGKFETSNDGNFYYITRKAEKKAVANGNTPAAATA